LPAKSDGFNKIFLGVFIILFVVGEQFVVFGGGVYLDMNLEGIGEGGDVILKYFDNSNTNKIVLKNDIMKRPEKGI